MPIDDAVDSWLEALEARHLGDLTPSEVARALRALSSCYVERREKLAEGSALGSAGKRAAFALFYAPLHFLVTREVVRALPDALPPLAQVIDLGCGTGAAGAAWAIEGGARRITGYDRHPWAVNEANWTYRQFGLQGRAVQADIARAKLPVGGGTGIIAAYAVNELSNDTKRAVLPKLIDVRRLGCHLLVIEPIARRGAAWWDEWEHAVVRSQGRSDEWRFPVRLPARQQQLARAAGLNPRELTARTLWL
jgi:SAM-dependent methyltransferase